MSQQEKFQGSKNRKSWCANFLFDISFVTEEINLALNEPESGFLSQGTPLAAET